jgi:calcineurin-like phosphoesterase family protein
MSEIYFTSDTHFHHKNIVKGVTTWQSGESQVGVRNFDTLEEHDETLVKNFNSLIKVDDILWHLGDWSFGGHEQIKIFADRLNCKNIHLIFGNHDQHIEPINSPYRNLFDSVQYYKEITFKLDRKWKQFIKTRIVLSHYSFRVWNKSHHGSIHLFGHSHGTLPDSGNRSMDVGVDTNDLYPYHLEEILYKMLPREITAVDHHNQNTN